MASSGAQADGQKRAEGPAATVTEMLGEHATLIEMLGQPSLDGRRKPGRGSRMTYPIPRQPRRGVQGRAGKSLSQCAQEGQLRPLRLADI